MLANIDMPIEAQRKEMRNSRKRKRNKGHCPHCGGCRGSARRASSTCDVRRVTSVMRQTVLVHNSLTAMVEIAALRKGGCRLVERSWRQRGYTSMIEEDSWMLRRGWNKVDYPGFIAGFHSSVTVERGSCELTELIFRGCVCITEKTKLGTVYRYPRTLQFAKLEQNF